jgi:hypothetical protein
MRPVDAVPIDGGAAKRPVFHRYVIDRQNRKMTDQKGVPAQAPAYRTTRMEAFSDGVFAIAITLLVLEIAVPSGSEANLLGAVLGQWPSYLAYIVSFSTIGAVWLEHTVIT